MGDGKLKIGKLTATSKKILQELLDNPHGLRAKTITKLINKPKRTTYNNLTRLQDAGLVKNIYPVWMIAIPQSAYQNMAKLLAQNKIQLHNVSFVVKLIRKPHWWEKRNNRMMRVKEFQARAIKWGNNPYTQLIKNNFIIQLFSNSIIVINRKKYWGEDSYDCFIQATEDFLDVLTYIEERLNFKFFLDEAPQVMIRSHHYVMLRDAVAKRCKQKNNKFEVVIDGKLRMWVDMSEPLGVEAGHKDYAPEDMRKYAPYVADFVTKEPPLVSDLSQDLIASKHTTGLLASNLSDISKHTSVLAEHVNQQMADFGNLITGTTTLQQNTTNVLITMQQQLSQMQVQLNDLSKSKNILTKIKEWFK